MHRDLSYEEMLFALKIRNNALTALHRDTGLPSGALQNITYRDCIFHPSHYTITTRHHGKISVTKTSTYDSYTKLKRWTAYFKQNSTQHLFICLKGENKLNNNTVMNQNCITQTINPYYAPKIKNLTQKTQRKYALNVERFEYWCRKHKLNPMTLQSKHILQWMTEDDAIQGRSLSSLLNARSALTVYFHRLGRHDQPTKDIIIQNYLKDISLLPRSKRKKPRNEAAALQPQHNHTQQSSTSRAS